MRVCLCAASEIEDEYLQAFMWKSRLSRFSFVTCVKSKTDVRYL